MKPKPTRQRRYHLPEPAVPPEMAAAVECALAALAPVRRDKALPLLQEIQAALGCLPAPALALASKRSRIPLADLNALVSFYDMLSAEPGGGLVVHVCDDIVCRTARAGAAEELRSRGFQVRNGSCLGQCDRAPAAYNPVGSPAPGDMAGDAPSRTRLGWPDTHAPLLLDRCGRYDPAEPSLEQYTRCGGLDALRKARMMAPGDLVRLVRSANLLGRGGAAFPAGVKWEGVLKAPTPLGPGPDGALKYVVVNADESEPGTFTNRVLLEHDPLAVVEAALIAAHGVGAQQVYIYVRGEYRLAAARIRSAVTAMASMAGHVAMEVRQGAGAYICGEETALFSSIEGKRGEPRNKPPFPTASGLFGRPTLIHNVETLHNLLPLLRLGANAWNAVQPKLFSVSGHVADPGVYEAPLGIPLAELIQLAGGPAGELQAVLVGGAAGMFVGPDRLEIPLEFKAMAAAGLTLGSGAVMLFDRQTDLWDVALRAARFFAHESCGQCIPCRIGTARQAELVERFAAADHSLVPLHAQLSQVMADASICALGQTAPNLTRSLLRLKGVTGA